MENENNKLRELLNRALECLDKPKDKTLDELESEWLNNYDAPDLWIEHIKANPEAYIKAIQNLKK